MTLIVPLETPPAVLDAMRQLLQDVETEVPKMPEALFIQHLLPLLRSQGEKVDLTLWLDIAGTPNRSIDVVAPSGEVLFRLPPLIQSTHGNADLNGRRFGDIIGTALLKKEIHPRLADTYVEQQLNTVKMEHKPTDARAQLAAILARYDGSVATPSAAPAGTGTNAVVVESALSEEDDPL